MKCEKKIANWKKRKLSILGRIVVTKSLILPNSTYIASHTVIPKDSLQKFKTLIYNFIWNGKRDKIKRSTLSTEYKKGGLKMIDIDNFIKSIHIGWITKLFNTETDNWTVIPRYYLNKFGNNLIIFHMNLKI